MDVNVLPSINKGYFLSFPLELEHKLQTCIDLHLHLAFDQGAIHIYIYTCKIFIQVPSCCTLTAL